MENEQDGTGSPVSRGQNQLHVLPEDWQSATSAIEPLLARIDAAEALPQLLVVTNDAEAAAAIAGRLAAVAHERGLRTVAATDTRRTARVLRGEPAQVVIAPAPTIIDLLQATTLKLDAVRAVVLAWVDELDERATSALEALMAELPKDSARVVIAAAVTPVVDQLVERYARRARRVQPAPAEASPPVSLSYVTVHDSGRAAMLRRILDALDPPSAFVVARNGESRATVDALLRSLGYADASAVRVGELPDVDASLIVLFDIPGSEDELRRLVAQHPAARVIAIVTPRQLSALRRFAGGVVSPFGLPEAAARAQTREDALREELRSMLTAGQFSRELLALEPLLSEFDGPEIAAAALRLLDAERAKPVHGASETAATQSPMTRLYLNVGAMDNVRPSDLVGAITNEAGISKADLGKVDVRERHSTVEVSVAVANAVVSKLTGVSIRNRRVLVRVDEGPERPARPRRDDVRLGARDNRDRGGPPSRDRGSRPPRDRKREDRPRRERPE